MKIVSDDKIPFINGVFEVYGIAVEYIPGANICAHDLKDAQVLIVRTRTRCNAALLDGSAVKMIATATIGFDHIDVEYCKSHNIRIVTSAGCNARGVAQYVMAALAQLKLTPSAERTLGVVGVGNVGSVVETIARSVGYKVLCCDSPRMSEDPSLGFVSLQELARRADIITFHVPLTAETTNLINVEFMSAVRRGITLINTSRGEIIDQTALLSAIRSGHIASSVVDVWRNEPNIDLALLSSVTIGTPHIAGYSLQGKAMGSALAVRAIAKYLGIEALKTWYPPTVTPTIINNAIQWTELMSRISSDYDILGDSIALKSMPENFELLRSSYNYRPESF